MNELEQISEEKKQEVFDFFTAIRKSGELNMFGVAPVIRQKFGFSTQTSRKLLFEWIKSFKNV